jgi:hypothetical protein
MVGITVETSAGGLAVFGNLSDGAKPVLPDYEYKREGTAVVFEAVAPKLGWRLTDTRYRRTAIDFAKVMGKVALALPKAKRIHMVLDNLNIHCLKSLIGRFGERKGRRIWRRFKIHYTPTHASWLNQAEIELNVFGSQCLGKRGILRRETQAWARRRNRSRATIQWTFTKRQARRVFRY